MMVEDAIIVTPNKEVVNITIASIIKPTIGDITDPIATAEIDMSIMTNNELEPNTLSVSFLTYPVLTTCH